MTRRYTAAYLIAFHLGWDQREVTDGRYQRTRSPTLYVCGSDYFCCPSEGQKPPRGYSWEPVGTYYGRTVHRAKPEEADDGR